MPIEIGPVAALLVLALVTYLTRIGGLVIMSRVALTRRVERGLSAVAGSVLVAVVVPAVATGDPAATIAVATALAVSLLTRNSTAAMAAGVAGAVVLRLIL